jgi:hypothetical protein
MFTVNLITFKTQQAELHKQAEHYRLVRSLEKTNPLLPRIIHTIGQTLIQTGQLLISRTQTAH